MKMPDAQFDAPWGLHLKIMTIGGSLVCIGMPLVFAHSTPKYSGDVTFGFLMAPVALWFLCFLSAVRGYTITREQLLIHRLIWVTRIPLEELVHVDFDVTALRQSIRYFGNGGIFAICGLFQQRIVFFVIRITGIIEDHHLDGMAVAPEVLIVFLYGLRDVAEPVRGNDKYQVV